MGNSQGRESRQSGRHHHHGTPHNPNNPAEYIQSSPQSAIPDSSDRSARPANRGRIARGSRPDLSSILSLGVLDREAAQSEQRRETKQEREARRLEKEKIARAEERGRSLRTEGVDGGFLVTLGVYTGPEDYSKATVRQLQVIVSARLTGRSIDSSID